MDDEMKQRLSAAVMDHYQVGPNFAQAYLDFWYLGYPGQKFENLDEILNLPAPQSVWFNFALSANVRGQRTYQALLPHMPTNARRYLDIGCGYGGSLVAFAQKGLEVVGIDIDDRLLDLAKANCLDIGLQDCVHHISVLEPDLVSRLGTFDVISLLAVIEHVPDVPQTLKNAVQLLSPGGVLTLDIPNKDSLNIVAHDPHFDLFGLTLLEHPDAFEYFRQFFSFDYDVGEFYQLQYYQDLLRQEGCDSFLVFTPEAQPGRLREFRPLMKDLIQRHRQYNETTRPKLPAPIQKKVQRRLVDYFLSMGVDFLRLSRVNHDERSFQVRYLTNIWTLMVRKTGAPASTA